MMQYRTDIEPGHRVLCDDRRCEGDINEDHARCHRIAEQRHADKHYLDGARDEHHQWIKPQDEKGFTCVTVSLFERTGKG